MPSCSLCRPCPTALACSVRLRVTTAPLFHVAPRLRSTLLASSRVPYRLRATYTTPPRGLRPTPSCRSAILHPPRLAE